MVLAAVRRMVLCGQYVLLYSFIFLRGSYTKRFPSAEVHPPITQQYAQSFGGGLILSLLFTVGYPALDGSMPKIIYKLIGQTILPYLWLFVIGILVYEYREKLLPVLTNFWYIPLGLYYVVRIFRIDITGTYINPLSGILLLITVFALGYRFNRISIKRDYSYGLYLYHMVTINIILHAGILSGIWAALSVVGISLIVSALSSEFVKWLINEKAG